MRVSPRKHRNYLSGERCATITVLKTNRAVQNYVRVSEFGEVERYAMRLKKLKVPAVTMLRLDICHTGQGCDFDKYIGPTEMIW